MTQHRRLLAGLGLSILLAAPAVQAAQSYDNCTGFIDSLPATISTQGTWCLRKDLATGITASTAISVATNNVTIDCNDFKVGGLSAGLATDAIGIGTSGDRQNITVRRCNIRGFRTGINLSGAGHVVEGNNLNGITFQGMQVIGDGSIVRNNTVLTTGGSTKATYLNYATAISTANDVDILDNTVSGVMPTGDASGNANAAGIYSYANLSGTIARNRVRGVSGKGTGTDQAIRAQGNGRVTIVGNTVNGTGRTGSVGVQCQSAAGGAIQNITSGFATAVTGCAVSGTITIP